MINGQGFAAAVVARPEECTGCAICAEACPDVCIVVWR
jgi:2-oxoglutarate ferredoxin oxidoreductase subunit delta